MKFHTNRTLTIENPRYAVQSAAPHEGQEGAMILNFPLPTVPEATNLAIVLNRNTAEEFLTFIRKAIDNMKGLKPDALDPCFHCGKPAIRLVGMHDDCAAELKK